MNKRVADIASLRTRRDDDVTTTPLPTLPTTTTTHNHAILPVDVYLAPNRYTDLQYTRPRLLVLPDVHYTGFARDNYKERTNTSEREGKSTNRRR